MVEIIIYEDLNIHCKIEVLNNDFSGLRTMRNRIDEVKKLASKPCLPYRMVSGGKLHIFLLIYAH